MAHRIANHILFNERGVFLKRNKKESPNWYEMEPNQYLTKIKMALREVKNIPESVMQEAQENYPSVYLLYREYHNANRPGGLRLDGRDVAEREEDEEDEDKDQQEEDEDQEDDQEEPPYPDLFLDYPDLFLDFNLYCSSAEISTAAEADATTMVALGVIDREPELPPAKTEDDGFKPPASATA